ncbi:hypothetical protein F5Y03DRAFT_404398 [Xylaria venustula]|nr:hypothetical protein F5Y03DRAFT_404398 [Xylaria venustula]
MAQQKVDLNFEEAIPSSRASSQPTATLPLQDFPVFTTDSSQSPWLPSSSSSQPAPSAQHQHSFQSPPQQDFVLFDSPQPTRTTANRTASSSATTAAAFGSLNNNTNTNRDSSNSPALQNQRVQQILEATGHQFSPSALTNRFNSTAQNQSQPPQFYASLSTPSSASPVNQQTRVARPPVPLFTQGIGSQRRLAKMDLQGNSCIYQCINHHNSHELDAMCGFGDFTAFGGGASPSTAFSSPAIHGCDLDVGSASSSTHLGTVSPGELLIREQFSAPNSTAFTNLTTPSNFGDSPEFENFEVSPNFGDFEAGSSENWYPLFPEAITTDQVSAQTKSPPEEPAELEIAETESLPRRKSGTSPSLSANHGRHSSVSGVNSRRREKPLPPIVVDDPNDSVAMKRARNTLAARKSRERKAAKMEELEEMIVKLTEERDLWKRRALSRPNGA